MKRLLQILLIGLLLSAIYYLQSWKGLILAVVGYFLFIMVLWVIDFLIDSSERWEG